jgi:hypothetical protein
MRDWTMAVVFRRTALFVFIILTWAFVAAVISHAGAAGIVQ